MADYRVGTAHLAIRPDFKNFRKLLGKGAKEKSKGIRARIKVEPDFREFEQEIRRVKLQKHSIDFKIKADWKGFWTELMAGKRAAERAMGIEVNADTAKARAELEKFESARKSEILAGVSTANAEASLAALARQRTAKVNIKLQGYQAAMDRLKNLERDRKVRYDFTTDIDEYKKAQQIAGADANMNLGIRLVNYNNVAERLSDLERDRQINVYTKFWANKADLDHVDDTETGHVLVRLKPNFTRFNAELEAWKKANHPEIQIRVRADTASAREKIKRLTRTEHKRVVVTIDQSAAAKATASIRNRLESMGNSAIGVANAGFMLSTLGIAAAGAVPPITALADQIARVGKISAYAPALINAFAGIGAAGALAFGGVAEGIGKFFQAGLEDIPKDLSEAEQAIYRFGEETKTSIRALGEIQDSFIDLRKHVQDSFFKDLGAQVRDLANVYFPSLRGQLGGLASGLNDMAESWITFKKSDQALADFNFQMSKTRGFLTEMADAVGYWSIAWNNLATVGSKDLPDMGKSIKDAARDFAEWTTNTRETGELAWHMRDGLQAARNVGRLFGGTMSIVGDVFAASVHSASDMTEQMLRSVDAAKAWTSSLAGQSTLKEFFTTAGSAADKMGEILRSTAKMIFQQVTPLFDAFLTGVKPGLLSFIDSFGRGLEALTPSAEGFGRAIGGALVGLQAFGAPLIPFVNNVLPRLMDFFAAVSPMLGALMGPVASMVAIMTAAHKFAPLLLALQAIADKPWGGTTLKIVALTGALATLATAFTPFADLLETVGRGLVSFNDALGGLPGQAVAAVTGLALLRRAWGELNTKVGITAVTAGKTLPGEMTKGQALIASSVHRTKSAFASLRGTMLGIANRDSKAFAARFGGAAAQVSQQVNNLDAQTIAATRSKQLYAARTLDAYKNVGKLGGAAGLAGAAVKGLGGVAAKTGGALMALAGGWVGIGLMTGAAIIGTLVDAHKKWNDYIKATDKLTSNLKNSSGDMFDAIASGKSKIEATRDALSKYRDDLQSLADTAPSGAERFMHWWTDVSDERSKTQWQKDYEKRRDAADDAKRALEAMDKLNMSEQDMAGVLSGSDEGFKELKENLKSIEDGEHAVRVIEGFRREVEQVDRALELVGPNGIAFSNAIKEIAEAGADAEGRVNKFREALMMLNGDELTAAEGASRLRDELDRITRDMGDIQPVSLKDDGTLDTLDDSASSVLHQKMMDLGNAIGQAAEAGNDVNEIFAQTGPVLEQMRQAAGLSDEQWRKLLETYEMTPEQIETAVKVSGRDEAEMALVGVHEKLKEFKEGEEEPFHMRIDDKDAISALDNWGFKVAELKDTPGTFKIEVEDELARQRLDAAKELMSEVDGLTLKTIIDSDIDPLLVKATEASGILEYIPDEKKIVIDANAQETIDKLKEMGYEVSEPKNGKVTVEYTDAIDAHEMVKKLGIETREEKHGTVVTDSNTQEEIDLLIALGLAARDPKTGDVVLSDNIDTILKRIKKLERNTYSKHTVTIYETRQEALKREGKPSDFIGPVVQKPKKQQGGRIPAFAEGGRYADHGGYRLPGSGPGTERVDGFLGVDAQGAPLAWLNRKEWVINARSSELYNTELAMMNAGTFPKLPGFAAGGMLGKILKPHEGTGPAGAPASPNIPDMGGVGDLASTIGEQLEGLPDLAATTAEGLTTPLADAFSQIDADAQSLIGSAQQFITDSWNTLASDTDSLWNGSIVPSMDSAWNAITSTINTQWNNAGGIIQGVTWGTVLPSFSDVQGGLGNTVQAFDVGTGGIINRWNDLREGTAAPARFAIGSVFNDGIVGMWNSAAPLLGTKTLSAYPLRFADGGHVRGPGGPRDDKIPALLSDGEFVINAKAVKAVGLQNLHALNSGDVNVAPRAYRSDLPKLMETDETWNRIASRYADGGPVKGTKAWEQLKRGMDWARSLNGRPYVLGGDPVGGGGTDCCLTGDTMVYGPDGAKRMDEIAAGDLVYSFVDGRKTVETVANAWFSKTQDVYRVRTRNRSVVASDNHPFLRLVATKAGSGPRPAEWDVEWARTDELERGDILISPKTLAQDVKFDSTLPSGRHIDIDEAWLLGLILGDGSILDKRVNVCVYEELAAHAETTLLKMGAVSVTHTRQNGVIAYSTDLARELAEAGFKGEAVSKRVPECVWSWEPEKQRAFLDGYCDADGHYPSDVLKHGERTYHSASRAMLAEIRALHIILGDAVSNISTNSREGKKIVIKGKEVKDAKPIHSFSVWRGLRDGSKALRRHKGIAQWIDSGDFTVSTVLDVEHQGVADTYDIEVDGAHNFIADGIVVHNSGYMSSIADRIQGGPGHRRWATGAFNNGGNTQMATGPQGFVKGLAAGFSIGVKNGGPAGGHTAGTLGGVPGLPAVNVESGGGHGNVAFGGPAVGADHGQFPTRYHLGIIDGEFVSGGAGSYVPLTSIIAGKMKPFKDKIAAMLAAWGKRAGYINALPKITADKVGGAAEKKLMALAAEQDSISGAAAGVDLSGVSGDTQNQVREVFARHGWTGRQWQDAAWIIGKESSWNTDATNSSSGAYGLFQFNPMGGNTLGTYLPDRSSDPKRQADAGARYIKDRYGSPSAARAFWEKNGWYDNGGWLKPGTTLVHNETGKPEPVFNPAQWKTLSKAASNGAGLQVAVQDLANAARQVGFLAPVVKALDGFVEQYNRFMDSEPAETDEDGNPIPVFTAEQWLQLRDQMTSKAIEGDWQGVADDLSIAADVLAEAAARINWREVEREAVDNAREGFIDGQLDDVSKVFGLPSIRNNRYAKAVRDVNDSWEKDARSNDKSRERAAKKVEDAEKRLAETKQHGKDGEELESYRRAVERLEEAKAELDGLEVKSPTLDGVERRAANRVAHSAIHGAVVAFGNAVGQLPRFAGGGPIPGSGGPTADNVPILASAGEFMVRAASAAAAPELLAAMNASSAVAAAMNGAFNGVTGGGAKTGARGGDQFIYNIHASSVDEGMRRAEMHARQTVARGGMTR